MYYNCGDVDFFEQGILIDMDASEGTEYRMLRCSPYSDQEDMFLFGELIVDISDDWIDQKSVESFADCKKEEDPVNYAIACTDYYSWDNFGEGRSLSRKEVKKELAARGVREKKTF